MVGGAVAPDPLSVFYAELFSQRILDELYDGQY